MRLSALLFTLFSGLLAPALGMQAVQAQTIDRPYGTIRGWTVTAHFQGDRHVACTAEIDLGARDGGQGMAQSMALSRDDRGFWSVRVPAGDVTVPGLGRVLIDDRDFRTQIELYGTAALFPVSREMIDAIRAGSRLFLRDQTGAESPPMPLNGTAAATARVDECLNLRGLSPSAPETASAAPGSLQQGSNCPIFGTVASSGGGAVTKVTFVNQTQRPLSLFWIDETAQPHEMVRLEPGHQARLDATTGDVWVVRGLDGDCLGGLIQTPATGGFVYLQ